MTDLTLRCQCGRFQAVVRGPTPRTVNRVVCSCKFCQSYARHLGRAEEILDDRNGTDIVQVRPSSIELVQGQDQLACIHLSATGARRWYTRCCRTPIANTMANGTLPFVGLLISAIDQPALGRPLDEVVGPVRARMFADYGDQASEYRATRWHTTRMMVHFAKLLAGWWLQGAQRKSPFFGADGQPIVTPQRVKLADAET